MSSVFRISSFLAASLIASNSLAGHSGDINEIHVTELPEQPQVFTLELSSKPVADTAALLKSAPGANVNGNGPITGIAQYRGMYGDRVSIHIDQMPALTGGPNAMDTPLSYTPPLLLKELGIQRGIASVSAAQESLGGHISASLDRGQFTDSDDWSLTSAVSGRLQQNGRGYATALKSAVANQQHKISLLASHDEADDIDIGGNDTLEGTEYRRSRYDLSYGWQNKNLAVEAFYGILDTRNSGTPALPMDIQLIDSELSGINLTHQSGNRLIKASLSYNEVLHRMDNFSQRLAPMPMQFRQTEATAHNTSWSLQSQWQLGSGIVTVGTDGNQTTHTASITNPNQQMPMFALFEIENFNNSERNGYGLFTEWQGQTDHWIYEVGARINSIELDSDPVSATIPDMAMQMMTMRANMLASQFNNGDIDETYHNTDLVLKASTHLSDKVQLNLGLAQKTRAPSYQERFLWLPLPAAAGLADGRNYIGNLNLDSETSREVTAGIDWKTEQVWISPQLFYRRIDDYIQGTATDNATANQVAMMMSGKAALMFNNIDAELYGFDVAYGATLSSNLRLEGTLNYVRGKRRDASDDLYRIAPLNNTLSLIYQHGELTTTLQSVLYTKQDKVSSFNDEEKTSGYGLLNLHASYRWSPNITINAGVDNLLDQEYQDHLAGYNRNGLSDIAIGERLYGAGTNFYIGFNANW